MATVRVRQCDRCGVQESEPPYVARTKLPVDPDSGPKAVDICEGCLESFRAWWATPEEDG